MTNHKKKKLNRDVFEKVSDRKRRIVAEEEIKEWYLSNDMLPFVSEEYINQLIKFSKSLKWKK